MHTLIVYTVVPTKYHTGHGAHITYDMGMFSIV